jgi:peptidoglycan/LPS O-acetylase OafA/YrhL
MQLPRWLTPERSEWPVLAVVRFVMSLVVVVYHIPVVAPHTAVPLLSEVGALGCICGFLVISGYSIAHSITSQPKGFYRRRAWRIMPIYYATLALSVLPYWFGPQLPSFMPFPDYKPQELIGSLFFLQCLLVDKVPIFGPSWTLAVEWWFYMLAPIFVRLPNWVLLAIIGASAVFQKEALQLGYFPVHAWQWGIPAMLLLWAWLLGFVFYRVRGWSAFLVVLAGYLWVGRFPDGSPAAYLLASLAVVTARSLPRLPRFLARLFNYLGDLSYPLYLVHAPLLGWVGHYTTWTNPYLYVALSLGASAFLNHAVDIPLRARFASRRPKPSLVASQPVSA